MVALVSPGLARDQSDDLFPGVQIELRCLVIKNAVKIDRPFLYSIVKVHQETGNSDFVPLFIGTVTVPIY
ncbi:unnamed protein product [Lasius platythorax]|uniref:Uncharacterized protein n=1 Tax=Lasius platythorax TaxID=488582 RepID=A0AAV2P232_9HYME